MTDTLILERRLPHAQDKVWRALTQSQLMADWLMANDFEAQAGHHFQFRAQPGQARRAARAAASTCSTEAAASSTIVAVE